MTTAEFPTARHALPGRDPARDLLVTRLARAAFPVHDPECPDGWATLTNVAFPLVAPWVDAALADGRLTLTLTEETA
ncbi:hypothetical protein [Nocardia sp. CC227C]|uniref:hypothetical protein n=1 Tax=Nocardia sp. CC227C TaxID=3044562 RepID=UPI00278BE7EF|nr:hypothetical protein [Nocardia sp. CC227C]